MLKINNLAVRYKKDEVVLHDINLSLSGNCICGLVGMNGAGKSTLFKAIMGLTPFQAGDIKINQHSIKTALKKNLLSYVPQNNDIDWNFPLLVKEVVMMGRFGQMGLMRRPTPPDHLAVNQAIEKLGLSDLQDRQIGELSGGQKKRMFVARALAHDGDIILLDEPFNEVDINTEKILINLFKSLAARGKLILVSTHNLGSVPHFCEQVVLINKKIVAQGPVHEVFNSHNLSLAFGQMLRHLNVSSSQLHEDVDPRSVTILSDDEHPLVLYGSENENKIVQKKQDD